MNVRKKKDCLMVAALFQFQNRVTTVKLKSHGGRASSQIVLWRSVEGSSSIWILNWNVTVQEP